MHQNTRDRGDLFLVYHAVSQYAAGCHFYLGDSIWNFDRSGVFLWQYGLDWRICSVRIALLAGRKTLPILQTFTYLAVTLVYADSLEPYLSQSDPQAAPLKHSLCTGVEKAF